MASKKFMFGEVGPEEISPAFYDELTDLRASKRSKDFIKSQIIQKGFDEDYATKISNQIDKEVKENKIGQAKAMIVFGAIILLLAIWIFLFAEIGIKPKILLIIVTASIFGKGMNTFLYYKGEDKEKPYWKRV